MRGLGRWGLGLLLAGHLVACGVEEAIRETFRGETPQERYLASLERAGLAESSLALRWREMSEAALRFPIEATPPMVEAGRFDPSEPTSLAYRVSLLRGERMEVRLDLTPSEPTRTAVFLELHRLRDPDDREDLRPLLVASPDPGEGGLEYEARATAEYLLRVQPELLLEAEFRLELRTGPSLAFPVEGHGTRHIQSVFGDDREGGRRVHHGVDVFAPRGTPVLAAGPGEVSRVRETPVGGKVVWVRDDARGLSRYYAHLDSQAVSAGVHVRAGDTLGFVGNTGNAITTPPHLHFGIYVRGTGPVDPWPFLHDPGRSAPPLGVDPGWYRQVAHLRDPGGVLRQGPSSSSPAVEGPAAPRARSTGARPAPAELRVLAASGDWARVRQRDGSHGYVRASDLEPTTAPARTIPGAGARVAPQAPSPPSSGPG